MSASTPTALDIKPINGNIGAEVRGVQLSGDLHPATLKAIQDAVYEHKVIVVRDQHHIDDAQQEAFGRLWGELVGHPTVLSLGGTEAIFDVDGSRGERASSWHADSSYDVLGGPHTFNLIWAKDAFRTKNPKTYAAFLGALKEAVAFINADHSAAADAYLALNKGDLDKDFVLSILKDPDIQFTIAPSNVGKYADFMHKVGAIKNKPASWKELFFEDVHTETGS